MTTSHASATPDLPLDMIIFGGAGDLSARKLLPALFMAHSHGNLPAETRILAIGRREWTREQYVNFMDEHSKPFIERKALDAAAWDKFLALFDYVRVDVDNADDYARLAQSSRPNAQRIFYLATSPELFTTICDNLSSHSLIDGLRPSPCGAGPFRGARTRGLMSTANDSVRGRPPPVPRRTTGPNLAPRRTGASSWQL